MSDADPRGSPLGAERFKALYDDHAPHVYAICLRMAGGDEALAEELTQDVFVRAWQKRDRFGGWGSVGAWLRRLAVNVVLNRLRSERRREARVRTVDDPGALEAPAPTVESGDVIALEDAIKRLPEGARTVLVLSEIEGYPHREIAEMEGVSLGTVKSQLHRARRLLREELGQ